MSIQGEMFAESMPAVCRYEQHREWIRDNLGADGERLLALVEEGEREDPDQERLRLEGILDICEEWVDDLSDLFGTGTDVLTFGWSPEDWGHGGAVWIKEFAGLYFASSSDYDDEGPFSSIEAAVGVDAFSMAPPNAELNSSVLSLEELKEIARGMEYPDDEDSRIYLNETPYMWKDGDLVPAPETSDE